MLGIRDTVAKRQMWYLSDNTIFINRDSKPSLGRERGHPEDAMVRLTSADWPTRERSKGSQDRREPKKLKNKTNQNKNSIIGGVGNKRKIS